MKTLKKIKDHQDDDKAEFELIETTVTRMTRKEIKQQIKGLEQNRTAIKESMKAELKQIGDEIKELKDSI